MLRQQQPRTPLARQLLVVRLRRTPFLLFSAPPTTPPSTTATTTTTTTTTKTTTRPFTRHTNLSSHSHPHTRPQLPFLAVPLSRNSRQPQPQPQQHFRYLTTERKRWLAHELLTAGKYTVYFWALVGFGVAAYWSVQLEWLERRYPTPHEWAYLTRSRFRLARWGPDRTDVPRVDWVQVGAYAKNVVDRLEDPEIDGKGLLPLPLPLPLPRDDLTTTATAAADGDVWIDGIGNKTGYDIQALSEPWRRGYYEALMLCARAAEDLDAHVVDTTRHLVFPADQVRGPSNPHRKPIAPGSPSAPREEDCERAYEPPETFYLRILTTRGFTARQKMDAALAQAAWLDFKKGGEGGSGSGSGSGVPDDAAAAAAADKMYRWALSLASESESESGSALPNDPPVYDEKTYVLRDDNVGRKPSANVLACLTAFAAHKARAGDVGAALPILISVLRARRSLESPPSTSTSSSSAGSISSSSSSSPPPPPPQKSSSPFTAKNIASLAKRVIFEPEYPPPPDDGGAPPVRDARELCEEAGLSLYIGEIIYASQGGGNNGGNGGKGKDNNKAREDGLAWTREAVDIAEEQIHKLSNRHGGRGGGGESRGGDVQAAKKTCTECLEAGLLNWGKMVERLAREEREREEGRRKMGETTTKKGWLGLWGEGEGENGGAGEGSSNSSVGRWAAEEQVVKERTRRAREVLDELEAPSTGLGAIFWA